MLNYSVTSFNKILSFKKTVTLIHLEDVEEEEHKSQSAKKQ